MLTLYHGTSAKHLEKILKEGLQPRGVTKNSNYEDEFVSHPELIYLTDTHPMFYAVRAADKENIVILKLKVYERELFPDEDYVAQVLARNDKTVTQDTFADKLRELHKSGAVDPRKYKNCWKDSLDQLGTVACKPLPASRIVCYAEAPNHFVKLSHFGSDTSPPSGIGRPVIKQFFAAQYIPKIELLLKDGWDMTYETVMKEHLSRLGKLDQLSKVLGKSEARE